jgi:hypothetical protein
MLQYYECASAQHYEAYFHAIDRNHDDQLDFDEFSLRVTRQSWFTTCMLLG